MLSQWTDEWGGGEEWGAKNDSPVSSLGNWLVGPKNYKVFVRSAYYGRVCPSLRGMGHLP